MSGPFLLAIDTATTRIVAVSATLEGEIIASLDWPAGYRHGETLMPAIERLLVDGGLDRDGLAGLIVGTGPGTFTGLRVGIATAKGVAAGLGRPIVGVPTGAALCAAAADSMDVDAARIRLLLPAGPADRILVRTGERPRLLPAGEEPADDDGAIVLVAIDLDGRAPTDALDRGERARAGLAATLVRLGSRRLAAGDPDDLATLVPEYVTLPRGAAPAGGEVAWSHDPR